MEYSAGFPLAEVEHEARRNHRPKSLVGGRFLFWGFSSHTGCSCAADSRPRGKHEMI